MTDRAAPFLKVHFDESEVPPTQSIDQIPVVTNVCAAFEQATGWSLSHQETTDASSDSLISASVSVDAEGRSFGFALQPLSPTKPAKSGCAKEAAKQLGESIGELLRELSETRTNLWQREAELAVGIPVTQSPDEEAHLAERLEAVLKSGAEAIDCQAAAAYLLDEDTKHLKLRSCWGLPKRRFLDPPRPLRGAIADLEALVGHAVVLEDTQLLQHWMIPEEFKAAVCVPISSPTTPFGTLWAFCDQQRGFSVDQTNLLEIVAGRIAADLEREVLLHETSRSQVLRRQLTHASDAQQKRLPRIRPLVDGWDIAGHAIQRDRLGGDFYDWSVLPGGDLAVALGDAQGRMIEAAMTATMIQAALKSHGCYRHTAQQMVERVNETLWSASLGDQFASLLYGIVQPETGSFEYAVAGTVSGAIIGKSVRSLGPDTHTELGTQPDAEYPLAIEQIDPEETLVLFSEGVRQAISGSQCRVLWRLLQQNGNASAEKTVEIVQRFLEHQILGGETDDQSILVLKRHPA